MNLGNEERVIIRRTNKNDIAAVFDVFFNELSKQDKKYLAYSAKIKYRESWEKDIVAGRSCFITTIQNDIVGYMRVFPSIKNKHKGDLWDFVVHPNYRKRGIAKQMLLYLHRRFSEVSAKTDVKNIVMQTLLRNFGYQPLNPEAARMIKWTKK
jgi:ribosomal protein S18 acetylase RimI-like enzyme